MPNLPAAGARWLAAVLTWFVSTTIGAASAGGDPIAPVAAQVGLNVYSPSMDRLVPVQVLRPADTTLDTTGRNAIAGLSMSALSVLDLAVRALGAYQAVGSYSGCAQTSDPVTQAYVSMMVARYGANPLNMWGPPANPEWAANDRPLHANSLRGTRVYVSAGSHAWGYWQDALHDSWPMFAAAIGARSL